MQAEDSGVNDLDPRTEANLMRQAMLRRTTVLPR